MVNISGALSVTLRSFLVGSGSGQGRVTCYCEDIIENFGLQEILVNFLCDILLVSQKGLGSIELIN